MNKKAFKAAYREARMINAGMKADEIRKIDERARLALYTRGLNEGMDYVGIMGTYRKRISAADCTVTDRALSLSHFHSLRDYLRKTPRGPRALW
jgi:hypothetical protein